MSEFRLPELGEGVYEAEFVEWRVAEGDTIVAGQVLAEVLTDKANMDVPAPFSGTINQLMIEPGQQINVGDVILDYESNSKVAATVEQAAVVAVAVEPNGEPKRARPTAVALPASGVLAAPSVRRMARVMGVELARVRGSGPRGRILIDDLGRHVTHDPPSRAAAEDDDVELGVAGTQVKLIGLRRIIAEQMVRSVRTIPHYAYIDECDVSDLVRLRRSLKETYATQGIRLTYLAFVVKAVAAALADVPMVNSTLDESAGVIQLHDHYHVGIAISTQRGLIVPVIRDVDQLDLGQTAGEIERLSRAAREGRVSLDDVRDGTFTVTSIGSIGGLVSTPIINHPEVGIVGIGKITREPAFDEHDRVVPHERMYLSFSFDHRVVDGAVGACFGNAVIRQLENPGALLITAATRR